MKPETVLYLVRHGESEANAARRFAGQIDSPLTERGRAQAETVAEALREVRFDRVIASDLSRARDTAQAIARRQGLVLETFRELREIDMGQAAGKQFEDARQHPDWTPHGFVQWPGGESLEDALARASGGVERIVAESPGKTVCSGGHGGVTRILVSHFLELLPTLYRHPTPSANTNITIVRTDGITYRVDSLFEATHLDETAAAAYGPAVRQDLETKIRDVPDFPKPGILFKDITTLLKD
ncbi:MAG: histidine phosphatase family protein, partial [Chloroflexota bacterium]